VLVLVLLVLVLRVRVRVLLVPTVQAQMRRQWTTAIAWGLR
jgi:hypothetical protein